MKNIIKTIDAKDKEILQLLMKDCKSSLISINRATGLSKSYIYEKIKYFLKNKIIKKSYISVDFRKIGFGMKCYYILKKKNNNYNFHSPYFNNIYGLKEKNHFMIEAIYNDFGSFLKDKDELRKFFYIIKEMKVIDSKKNSDFRII
ncbi:MAG: hypothetical protein ACQER9_01925 [Nanobdellota archaeon]